MPSGLRPYQLYWYYTDIPGSSMTRWYAYSGPNGEAGFDSVEQAIEYLRDIVNPGYHSGQTRPHGVAYQVHRYEDKEVMWDEINPSNVTIRPSSTTQETNTMPLATVAVKRIEGALTLIVNAKELHEVLDTMGCKASNGVYANAPSTSYAVASTRSLSPLVFLRTTYPAHFNLDAVFERPPTVTELQKLCASSKAVVDELLTHYRPVDIKVDLVSIKKAVQ